MCGAVLEICNLSHSTVVTETGENGSTSIFNMHPVEDQGPSALELPVSGVCCAPKGRYMGIFRNTWTKNSKIFIIVRIDIELF